MRELPRDIETEKALLGAMMLDPKQIPAAIEVIKDPECFFLSRHQKIYKAVCRLFDAGRDVDIVTTSSALETEGVLDEVGGRLYLTEVCNAVVTTELAGQYATIIRDKADRRRLYRLCAEGARAAVNEQEFDSALGALAAVEKQVYAMARDSSKLADIQIDQLVARRWEAYAMEEDSASFKGVPTGFNDLDNLIDGFQESEHIILAARPGMGKTSLALDICRNVASRGKGVLLFTMEMSRNRIADRFICGQAMVSVQSFKRRELPGSEKAKVNAALAQLAKMPITVVDGQWNTTEIRSKIIRQQQEHGNLGLVVIDFLTKINEPRRGNISTHDLVGGVAQNLQNMAIELNVPILTLAQLSRAVERRDRKKPVLSDLRESGNIEEACDKVLFIYRDEYYNTKAENKGIAEIIVAKNRDGPVGTIELTWIGESTTFRDMEKEGRYRFWRERVIS